MSWDDAVATLLMGTERRPGSTGADLLRAVAVEATRRRAGAVATRTGLTLEHAAAETAGECSATAAQLLDLVLADHFGQASRGPLLTIWLEACAAAGQIVPARYVPTLLDFGNSNTAARPHIREVVGFRGRWLAGLAAAWPWFGPAEETADAPLGVVAAGLRAARLADPASGREQILTQAEGLAAADRAIVYRALATELSRADEPLLESLLDDRSRKIRRVAAAMLSRLPDSAWSARMVARMEALIEKRRRGGRFKVELPEELDAAAARDGIIENPPPSIGRHAWWLRQIVAAVPLSWWEATLDAAPAAIAEHAPTAEVRQGWIDAAGRQDNPRWAAALFDAEPDVELLEVMSDPDAAKRLEAACRGTKPFRKPAPLPDLAKMLATGPPRWSRDLSVAVADRIAATNPKATQGLAQLMAVLDRADPATADRLTAVAEGLSDHWQRQMRTPVGRIRFRSTIEQEFT